ncbi:hypothetical protein [Roseimaritima ulvae]|uniref:Transposase IS200-like domain-containing protein n=1 Tax=Roseimaritima ulvae TaxID=980254 RepID=A0A5B9QQH7_9BACT|nr:hypothetical protein [Roseimaritima ulvae]QEG39910.1 hypothetical protein UC8_19120 [Roseimaritima ulvae]
MGRSLRSEQVAADEVAILHITQRCVRRFRLMGVDPDTKKDYSSRREWIRRRMEALASTFAIDMLAYAILSNHMHLVIRTRPDIVAQWTDEKVAMRWLRVFPGRRLEEHLAEPTENDVKTLARDREKIATIRLRLSNVSWFMRALSEPIARKANEQEGCTGRFWEGRFKSQRITDEAGLLACSMYVDLNLVRAAMAEGPDDSKHTSAYDRIGGSNGQQIDSAAFDLKPVPTAEAAAEIRDTPIDELRKKRQAEKLNPTAKRIPQDEWLAPLTFRETSEASDPEISRSGVRASDKGFLAMSLADYLNLLRWTARQEQDEAKATMPPDLQGKLSRLGIDIAMWRDLVWNFKQYFGSSSCAGTPRSMSQRAQSTGRHWLRGQAAARACFSA